MKDEEVKVEEIEVSQRQSHGLGLTFDGEEKTMDMCTMYMRKRGV
jgi:hypothetical protein